MVRQKWTQAWVCVFLFLSFSTAPVFAQTALTNEGLVPQDALNISADAAILMDANTGHILYAKNAHKQRPPASTTKILTAILGLELGKPDELVVVSEKAAAVGESTIHLDPGEKILLYELVTGAMVKSGNDACVAIAEQIAGTEEQFVRMMNQKAFLLGALNTHFSNTNGLPHKEHLSTAYDLALMARYGMQIPAFSSITRLKETEIHFIQPDFFMNLRNTNKLLWWYPGTDGFKTGWIGPESGYCLASTVERDGLRLIAVVLGAPQVRGNFKDSMTLYNYGFATYQFKEFLKKGQEVSKVKVGKGDRDYITAITNERVGIMVPKGKGEGLSTKIEVFPIVEAPVSQGQVVGKVTILKENEPIEEFELIAKESVKKGSLWREYKKLFSEIINFD